MKKKGILIGIAAVVLLAAALIAVLATRGGGGGKASAMWLVKAQGCVAVTDGDGSDVPVESMPGLELRLGLYDGYSVGTRNESYGWINLDDTKLTKLDEESKVQINRTGRKLELVVDRGSLFFNVTKPLEDDETLEIRSSSMTMAIRGTCGWVSAIDGETFDVYIIEGRVRVAASAAGSLVPVVEEVTAGQRARMSIAEGTPTVTLDTFDEADVPKFVLEEARDDPDVSGKLAGIGIDAGGPSGGDAPSGPENPSGPDEPTGTDEPAGTEDIGARELGGEIVSGPYGDVSWQIVRVTPILAQDLPDVYYEKPVFYGDGAGIPEINAVFERQAEQFVRDRAGTHPDTYVCYQIAEVSEPVKGLVTVGQSFYEYDRNGIRPGVDTMNVTYDLETGRTITLLDVVDGTEQEVRELIKSKLDETEYGEFADYDVFDGLPLDLHSFGISEDGVRIFISYSALGLSGGGQFSASVLLPLSTRYGGPGVSSEPLTIPESYWTGEAPRLNAGEALSLSIQIGLAVREAQAAGNGDIRGWTRLFLLDGRPAALVITGEYSSASDLPGFQSLGKPVAVELALWLDNQMAVYTFPPFYSDVENIESELLPEACASVWLEGNRLCVTHGDGSVKRAFVSDIGVIDFADDPESSVGNVGIRQHEGADDFLISGLVPADEVIETLDAYGRQLINGG